MNILLEKKLAEWLRHGIISHQALESIQDYEAGKKGKSWASTSFLILGTAAIALGILSIIAANWEKIPAWIKLVNNFLAYAVILFYLYRFETQGKTGKYNLLLLFYYLMIPVSIGLISQVFNTSGELYEGLLLWTLPAIFPVFTSSFRTLYYLWLVPFTIGITDMLFYNVESDFNALHIAYLTIPPGFLLLSAIFRKTREEAGLHQVFFNWFLLTLVTGQVVYSLDSYMEEYTYSNIPVVTVFVIMVAASFLLYIDISGKKVLAAVPAALLYILPVFFGHDIYILRGIFFILLFISLALFFSLINQRRLFDIFLAIAGIRMLVLYFDAFGGLLMTGIGLVTSGVIIIASVFAYIQVREKLFKLIVKADK